MEKQQTISVTFSCNPGTLAVCAASLSYPEQTQVSPTEAVAEALPLVPPRCETSPSRETAKLQPLPGPVWDVHTQAIHKSWLGKYK